MKIVYHELNQLLISGFILETVNITSNKPNYLNSTSSIDERVKNLINRMTTDEKIGQMMLVDHSALVNNPSDIKNYFIGSIISGGDSDLPDNSAKCWAELHDYLQKYSYQTRLKIPVLFGINAVHGNNDIYGATIFPHNVGLGCTRNAKLIEKAAGITALEISATGYNWAFSPSIAIPRDERWGRTYEGFGETSALAQMMGSAVVRGLQGKSLSSAAGILACAKHYLADGGTSEGIDCGDTLEEESIIRKIHLSGYESAIMENVGSIMTTNGSINGKRISSSRYWITDVLKNELNFSGFAVSPWGALDIPDGNYLDNLEAIVNAGIDMLVLPFNYSEFQASMKLLIDEGKISLSRIDDAVKRILTKKFELGLFENPFAVYSLQSAVGSQEHREVARQCVRESLVLLKKKDGILPLQKTNYRILVAGDHADDIGYQCGGLTISWQGGKGNVTKGITILEGIKKAAPLAEIVYSENGNFENTKANCAVVVIGEKPYADGQGDSKDLNIPEEDVELIKKIKSYGNPVVLILISGRPLILEKIYHYCDVIFAAWLPGSEGDGISDVLFGDYSPTGVLSNSWPKNMKQVPINVDEVNYEPLYEYGFGITSFEDSPHNSTPVLLSAAISGDGKNIELTFNKRMKEASLSNAKFTIRQNFENTRTETKGSLKPGDDTTIILYLNKSFPVKNNLTVSFYGSIESEDCGKLDALDGIEILN